MVPVAVAETAMDGERTRAMVRRAVQGETTMNLEARTGTTVLSAVADSIIQIGGAEPRGGAGAMMNIMKGGMAQVMGGNMTPPLPSTAEILRGGENYQARRDPPIEGGVRPARVV